MKLSGQFAGGQRVQSIAQQIDVLPTILASLGMEVPAEVAGKSLIPQIRGVFRKEHESASPTVALANLTLDRIEIDSILRGSLHFMRWEPDQPDERVELFDLQQDPHERINVAPQRRASVGFLRTILKTSILTGSFSHEPGQLKIEGEVEQRLRALGYME